MRTLAGRQAQVGGVPGPGAGAEPGCLPGCLSKLSIRRVLPQPALHALQPAHCCHRTRIALPIPPPPPHTACSTLAALADERVKALFLVDPVDVTVYAPLGPDYPSAVAGLDAFGATGRSLPLAVVGSGLGGDCVPSGKQGRGRRGACSGLWHGLAWPDLLLCHAPTSLVAAQVQ